MNTKLKKTPYHHFEQINGTHPLKDNVPGSYVEYQARTKEGGKVAFFNFELAKEMGLIPDAHPHELNPELVDKILETFSLVIINEYDILHKTKFPEKDIKENTYMATRYLQLQHPNKQGKTSGDGRSIWNGTFKNKDKTWDISSCGTGATCLSPAANIQKKFFKTGDPSVSYGCGLSEVEEGLNTLFMSEVFHRNKITTERVLAIIEFKKGLGINIRAHDNLLRPSHFFRALKLSHYDELKKLFEYYTHRQELNGVWKDVPASFEKKCDYFLSKITEVFAKVSAQFEDDYIFCWLDWDGDNILMDGGIIDYGSVRQFGLFHHEYRYDDVDRYSTTILEQKTKAKYIVQCFAQIVDYLKTKNKKNLSSFKRHPSLKQFNELFEYHKNENLLKKMGINQHLTQFLVKNHIKAVKEFKEIFSYFEKSKSKKGIHKVEDGINWSAIFCMRDILRDLPQRFLNNKAKHLAEKEFIDIIKSSYATREDLKSSFYRAHQVKKFQKKYLKLIDLLVHDKKIEQEALLLEISMRSSVINRYDRITGNSVGNIVHRVMHLKPYPDAHSLLNILEHFLNFQSFDPEFALKAHDEDTKDTKETDEKISPKLYKEMVELVRYFREGL